MAAQAQAHAEPPTRSQLLQLWRAQGMSEAEQTFFGIQSRTNRQPPTDRPAAGEATRLGHQHGTDAHMTATLEAFHRLQEQQAQAAANPAAQPAPSFFQPPEPPPRPPTAPDRGASTARQSAAKPRAPAIVNRRPHRSGLRQRKCRSQPPAGSAKRNTRAKSFAC